ncbi:MAG: hypothetical protein NTX55_01190 [Candidatus Parcubacteria bacterium]|nr:hypothetical protein [Candidatus Parcubacteria bacterium]
MSRTPAVGVVEPSYWRCMAETMAECLEKGLDIPEGVYLDALRFFQSTMRIVRDSLETTPADITNYIYARRALIGSFPKKDPVVRSELTRFSEFLVNMYGSRAISEEEIKTAAELANFFRALASLPDPLDDDDD